MGVGFLGMIHAHNGGHVVPTERDDLLGTFIARLGAIFMAFVEDHPL